MYHRKELPIHTEIKIDGLDKPVFIHNGGMIITGSDGQRVSFILLLSLIIETVMLFSVF